MTREEKVQYWLDIATEDMELAKDMHKTRHWLYVAFMCHQVIEKTLKAYWTAIRDDIPPYTHNHYKLLEGCGLADMLSEEQQDFIDFMTPMHIEARYSDYKRNLASHLNEATCNHIIEQTNQFTQWILQKCLPVTKPSASSENTNG